MRFRFRKPVSVLALLLLCGMVSAQQSDVRGVVSDSLTGQRIPFANVVLPKASRGAAANYVGFYLIPNVPHGTYEIVASAIGYERAMRIISIRAGEPIELNFRLSPTPVQTDEVVVSGEAKKELTEINTSIHILEQKEIKLSPVTAQADLFHSLKMLPGIVSTSDVNSKFYVRGGAGDQNLVLLDGMKIYNPYHALGIYSVFDPDIVRTAEVYTGAFPPGFGGKLSSVINISAPEGRSDRLAGRANLNFLSSKLQLEGPAVSGLSWMVNGRKSVFSQTFKNIVRQDVPVSFYDLFFKITGQTTRESKFDVSFLTTADDLKSSNPDEPDYLWRNQALAFTTSGLLGDRLFVHAVASASAFKQERNTKSSPRLTPLTTSIRELTVRAAATLYTDRQDLYFFGFDFSFPKLEYTLVNNLGVPIRISSIWPDVSTWLRYQAKVDNFQLDGGLHLELGSMARRGGFMKWIQPRINLSYLLLGNWRAKASYGRFSQSVMTISNEDDVMSIFDGWIEVPQKLDAQHADHFVLGLEGNVSEKVSTNLQTYYKKYGSLVTYNREKIDASDSDYINGSGSSYGLEIMVRAGLLFVDLYGSYTLGWTDVNNRGLTYNPKYDRRHHLNVLGVLHLLERLTAVLRWEFGSGFPFTQTVGYFDRLMLRDALPGPFELETGKPYTMLGPKNAARLPAYHRLDASVVYQLSFIGMRGNFGVHIMNLYDNKNVFYFDRKTGQRVDMLSFFPSATLTIEY